jgi:hypothetical protein
LSKIDQESVYPIFIKILKSFLGRGQRQPALHWPLEAAAKSRLNKNYQTSKGPRNENKGRCNAIRGQKKPIREQELFLLIDWFYFYLKLSSLRYDVSMDALRIQMH